MYSPALWQHYQHPCNRGPLPEGGASLLRGEAWFRPCGDHLQLALSLDSRGLIERACFEARGCVAVIAVSSLGTQLLRGQSPAQARQMLPSQLDQALGGVPGPKRHALSLFLEALHRALDALPEEETLRK